MNNTFEIDTNFNMEEYLKYCNDIILNEEDFEEDSIRFKTPNEAFQYINDNFEKRGM